MSRKEREKRRTRKKRIKLAFVAFVFLYLLLRSIPSLGYKTKLPEKHTVYKKIESTAILIKDEKVYVADGEGQLKLYAKEGSKVPVGEKIAEIDLLNDKSILDQRLEEIDNKIEVLSEVEGKNVSVSRDLKEIEDNLSATIKEIQESIFSEDYDKAILSKDKLLMYYDKHKSVSGDNTLISNSLDSLKEERENILKQINSNILTYYSNESGVLSFKIDGYEDKFTYNNREVYGYEVFENLAEEETIVSGNGNVKIGEPIFKIINNFEWYMLIKIDNIKDIEELKEGNSITVSGKDVEVELKGRIVKVNKKGSKGTILCKFDRDFQHFYDKRIINVDIILGKYDAYKIPKKGLIELDGVLGVYIRDVSGIVRFRPVEILKEEKDYVYISTGDKNGRINSKNAKEPVKTVSQFDEILLNPKKVEEGMIIN